MNSPSGFSRRTLLVLGTSALAASLGGPALAQTKQRIGIIGSGNIGASVGAAWVKAGHPVMFSSRFPFELMDFAKSLGPLAYSGSVEKAIAFGDVLFIAVPYAGLPQIGVNYGAALKGKIVLDATNAVPTRDGAAISSEVDTNGIGITSQKYLPGTRLVRAFNAISVATIKAEGGRPDPKLAIPIAGDDAQAVQVAAALVRDAGFDPVLAGNLADARKFQQRVGVLDGPTLTAPALKKKLGLAP